MYILLKQKQSLIDSSSGFILCNYLKNELVSRGRYFYNKLIDR
jgi:hypothetical protein